jgi:hypothetical protein
LKGSTGGLKLKIQSTSSNDRGLFGALRGEWREFVANVEPDPFASIRELGVFEFGASFEF